MAIARKPKQPAEVDVDALIAKGGTPAGEQRADAAPMQTIKPNPVVVRIPSPMLAAIEQARQTRTVRIPRHTWILEALAEKLDRELDQHAK